MFSNYTELAESEVPQLIQDLKRFLGEERVDRTLQRYEKTLEISKSMPFYRDYYLKVRHPWLHLLFSYERSKTQSLTSPKNEMALLAYDAKKLLSLKDSMPPSIQSKYKSDLLDKNRAQNYLFEIDIAWQFFKRGWVIEWQEEANGRIPEFVAIRQDKKILVECKCISKDNSIKIMRSDFYKLVDNILRKILRRNVMGKIEMIFDDSTSIDDQFLRTVAKRIDETIDDGFKYSGNLQGLKVEIDLHPRGNIIVDPTAIWNDFYLRKLTDWHGTVLFGDYNGDLVDPLEISLRSEGTGTLLSNMRDILKDAAHSQLNNNNAGFLACHLSEFPNFNGLEINCGLSNMVRDLLSGDDMDHIVAIVFVSDSRIQDKFFGQLSQAPVLSFINPKCRFKNYLGNDFVSIQ